MAVAVGVDLGGTKVRLVLMGRGGEILSESTFPTGNAGRVEEVVDSLAKGIEASVKEAGRSLGDVRGVGVGCAGQISPDGRVVRFSPNLSWENVALADLLEDDLRRPVTLENDVRVAALGEATLGAGRGIRDMICIFVGTGVGSGILVQGSLLRGTGNLAGEVGHMKLDPEGPTCTCGGQGCLEVYAGGGHVRRRVLEALEAGASSVLAEVDEIHVQAVERAARRGDTLAARFWEEVTWSLGLGISNLITLFNPGRIIMGGGVVEASPGLLEHVRKTIPSLVTLLSREDVEVVRAQLGPRAGAIGACSLLGSEEPGTE